MSGRGAELAGESPVPVQLNELVEAVKNGMTGAEAELIRSRVAEDGKAQLPVDATRQALTALVRNALDSSVEGQCVFISAECASGQICFTVRDSGTGISPEVLARVSGPFFTTKGSGHHLGLGTFLVRLFAESLEGHLVFESEVGVGTMAILELPLISYDGERETSIANRR
jgi:signal transduction histidine kinase